jgi:hypothetical protein
MFVGYAQNHPGDTFRMYNPSSGGIHESRDVIWLRRMFYDTPLSPKEFQVQSDGVLRSGPAPITPTIEFDHVDDMETLDAAPVTAFDTPADTVPAPIPAIVEEEEEVVDDGNEAAPPIVPQQPDLFAPTGDQRGVSVSRYGRVHKPRDLYSDKTPDKHDDAARQRQQAQKEDDESDASEHEAEEEVNEDGEFQDAEESSDDQELSEICLGQIDITNVEPGDEFGLVGAGLGGGFENTAELKPMKYDEAMAGPDKENWQIAVEEEHQRFEKHKAVKGVSRNEVPTGARIMDGTWACKKKSNGVFRARLNLRGFKQVDGEHYDSDSVSSPVANIITIHIVLALIAIVGYYASLVDVRGAFLLGDWESEREIYMEVPQGWKNLYPPNHVLKLLKTVYSAKQSAKRF